MEKLKETLRNYDDDPDEVLFVGDQVADVVKPSDSVLDKLYNGLIAQGYAIPTRRSTSITIQSLKNCYNANFFIFKRSELNLQSSRLFKFQGDLNFAYVVIQDFLYAKYQKVLPFVQTPDKNFVIAVLRHIDPKNTYKFIQNPDEFDEFEQDTEDVLMVVQKGDKTVNVSRDTKQQVFIRKLKKEREKRISQWNKIVQQSIKYKELTKKMIDIQKEAIIENSKIIQPGILKNKIEYYLRKIESTIADNDYGILNDFGEPFQITANQIFKMRVEELVANWMAKERGTLYKNTVDDIPDLVELYQRDGIAGLIYILNVSKYTADTPEWTRQLIDVEKMYQQALNDLRKKFQTDVQMVILKMQQGACEFPDNVSANDFYAFIGEQFSVVITSLCQLDSMAYSVTKSILKFYKQPEAQYKSKELTAFIAHKTETRPYNIFTPKDNDVISQNSADGFEKIVNQNISIGSFSENSLENKIEDQQDDNNKGWEEEQIQDKNKKGRGFTFDIEEEAPQNFFDFPNKQDESTHFTNNQNKTQPEKITEQQKTWNVFGAVKKFWKKDN